MFIGYSYAPLDLYEILTFRAENGCTQSSHFAG